MKIAAISDVHGNLAALEAVLADIGTRDVDQIVNLGDILSGGLHPARTADRLISLNLQTIRGNHERQLLTLTADQMGLSDRHALASLRSGHIEWLRGLPVTLRLFDAVLLVHGTPDSDLVYLLETVTADGLRPATEAEIAARVGGTDAAVILCGHTHIARAVRLCGGRLIVNPGSVGLPAYDDNQPYPHLVESGSPHARYAIVSLVAGEWSAELIKVVYDWEVAAQEAEANGRMDWGRALRTGKV